MPTCTKQTQRVILYIEKNNQNFKSTTKAGNSSNTHVAYMLQISRAAFPPRPRAAARHLPGCYSRGKRLYSVTRLCT